MSAPTLARDVLVFAPLERGFGHTFGNTLRRVLLSSVEGAAVTAVRVAGAQHELSVLAGVREDVTDLVLNLRQLVCVLQEERVLARLQASGPGPVTAAAIVAPASLEILNPELVIAELAPGAQLELELTIERGRGYRPAAQSGPAPGLIAVDANFSPIKQVGYEVTAARVGSDQDQLLLEVATDGSLSPQAAVSQAAAILIDELQQFLAGAPRPLPVPSAPLDDRLAPWRDVDIESLELGVRAYNCLRRVGITTVADLAERSATELERVPSFGAKSLTEVRRALAAAGLALADEGPAPASPTTTTTEEDA